MTPLVMGLDGGGTKTILALADSTGAVVLYERAAGIGPLESGHWLPRFQALMQSLAPHEPAIAFGSFGMPSYDEVPAVSQRQREAVDSVASFPHCTLNDVHTAFEGAFAGRSGVLLLAGTGSMVWAGDAAGAHLRVGGWGHGIGDEGSGFWIGHEAVAALSHCLDGRAIDAEFAEAIASHIGLPHERRAEALMNWYYDRGEIRVKVAALARAVDALSEAGNATARMLLTRAADHLAAHVRAAWQRLPSLPHGVWSGVGSVMHSGHVARRLEVQLEAPLTPPALPPIGGALWRAATNAGWPIDEAWIGRLRNALALYSVSQD